MNTTAIKERGFVAYQHEVRAFLDGRQTQFRRIVNLADSWDVFPNHAGECWPVRKRDNQLHRMPCPFGSVGDRLWVRESIKPKRSGYGLGVAYVADDTFCVCGPGSVDLVNPSPGIARHVEGAKWPSEWQQRTRHPIHMPRWASRINLEITGVRVERLNEITGEDARAEGCPDEYKPDAERASMDFMSAGWFANLWESINGPGSWAANPWVWVVEVKRVEA